MNPPPLTLRLFGPLHATVHGAPWPRARRRSVEWVLALLTLRAGRDVSRTWLAGTLWPDSDESRALQNLRNDLVELRKALGPEAGRLRSSVRDFLVLDLRGADVDLVRFDAAIQSGDEESLCQAVSLYAGPLLEGCYEEWVLGERDARAAGYLAALEALAERADERGDPAGAIGYLRRAESLDPLRDSTTRRLMGALAAAGDPAAAIQVYRAFRIRLRDELGADPEEATARLFSEIRAAARRPDGVLARPAPRPTLAAPAGRPNALRPAQCIPPHPLTPLIGREQEVGKVLDRVRDHRLVTLVGGGGVGKTRLALEVALRVATGAIAEPAAGVEESAAAPGADPSGTARPPDPEAAHEVAWVELAPLGDGALVLPSVAAAFGLRDEGGSGPDALLGRLVARLSTGPALLIIDNCEHVLDAAAAVVEAVLARCPELRILATSRQRLGLFGEVAWRVPSLPVPDPEGLPDDPTGAIDEAMRHAAPRLFVERAASVRAGFRLASREDAAAVCRIGRRLDGIPLALELAAARAPVLTLQQIASRLDDRFALLTTGSRGSLPRHRTLRALIDWSYDQLPEAERTLLRRLSVFAGGWGLEAAEAVAGGGIGASADPSTLDLLDSLVDRSLVLVEELGGGLRYRMLETVREYAVEKLREEGEEAAARRSHAVCFLRLVEAAPSEREGLEPAWLDRLEVEHDNLRASLDWCLAAPAAATDGLNGRAEPGLSLAGREGPPRTAGDRVMGLRMAAGLSRFWFVRGFIAEGRQRLAAALAAVPVPAEAVLTPSGRVGGDAADLDGWLKAVEAAGKLALAQSDFAAAREYYERCRTVYERRDDPEGILVGLLGLGAIDELAGDLPAARSHFERSLDLARRLADRRSVAESLHGLGVVTELEGDCARAATFFEESVPIALEVGADGWAAWGLHARGFAAWQQGDLSSGRALLAEGLTLFRRMGHRYGMARSLERLAGLTAAMGEPERAAKLAAAAATLREAIDSPLGPHGRAECDRDLAAIREALGEPSFTRLWEEGRALTMEQAIDEALLDSPP